MQGPEFYLQYHTHTQNNVMHCFLMFLQKNLLKYRSKTMIKSFSFIALKSTLPPTQMPDDRPCSCCRLVHSGQCPREHRPMHSLQVLALPPFVPLLHQDTWAKFLTSPLGCSLSSANTPVITFQEREGKPKLTRNGTHPCSLKYKAVNTDVCIRAQTAVCPTSSTPLSLRMGFPYRSGPR